MRWIQTLTLYMYLHCISCMNKAIILFTKLRTSLTFKCNWNLDNQHEWFQPKMFQSKQIIHLLFYKKKFFACINFLEEAIMPAMSVKQPNIFSHMSLNTHWKTSTEIWALQALSSSDCFYIDQASSTVQLKIKEALHILWENPSLN